MNNSYLLDQGAVIYGLKSIKYPEVRCYGILITASCDIANSKVSKYYYLIGVEVDEWLKSTHCFNLIFKNQIKNKINEYKKTISNERLDAETLSKFDPNEIKMVIGSKNSKQQNKISTALDNYKKAKNIKSLTDLNNIKDIGINASKLIVEKLNKINSGFEYHYYYLPQESFLGNKVLCNGLIIDLQEIGFIIPNEANILIQNKGIDATVLSALDENTVNSLKKSFFLENDDFIDIEGAISSPWREHLMQRFSQGFVRIGLDGATNADFDKIANRVLGV